MGKPRQRRCAALQEKEQNAEGNSQYRAASTVFKNRPCTGDTNDEDGSGYAAAASYDGEDALEQSLARMTSSRRQRPRSLRAGKPSTSFAEVPENTVTGIDDTSGVSRDPTATNGGALHQCFRSGPTSSASQEYQPPAYGAYPQLPRPARAP